MIVVDCSLIMAGILTDEESTLAEEVLSQLSEDKLRAIVPIHFYLECQNVLFMAHTKKRINKPVWQDYLETLAALPFEIDSFTREKKYFLELSDLASTHQLTIYDAVYLELAKRKSALLATLDKKLQMAARKCKVLYT